MVIFTETGGRERQTDRQTERERERQMETELGKIERGEGKKELD